MFQGSAFTSTLPQESGFEQVMPCLYYAVLG
jgi:hypothetical protein